MRTMAEAVSIAFDRTTPGGVVLLAPACSSFDMFTDYADRGEKFREAVTACEVTRTSGASDEARAKRSELGMQGPRR
jgi:UDP-N-acetylmuramoylalanine--D-glutamate ligase